ncbi:MAG: 6-phosphogluconolactonase [Alphaproteobacteria bacterium]|nr:6-phosphogluconolactonase [Alphaproteobacteria bacterium]
MSAAASVEVAENPEALAHRAAQWLTGLAAASRGPFAICLSGGSTPRRLYQMLGEGPYREALPWDRMHWFWGDERFVPWDHPDSNYGMVYSALLGRLPAPPENIHGIATNGTPAEAAAAYERLLKYYYGSGNLDPARPLFDIQILGLGPDGHTASLIPATSALDERRRWVVEVIGARPEPRITLTYPVLESSRHTAFLVAGAEKQEILSRALAGDQALPAARLRPVGELTWFVDQAARPSP